MWPDWFGTDTVPDCAKGGSYTRAAVAFLEGRYLTLRPSFGQEGTIFAYVTEIPGSGRPGAATGRAPPRGGSSSPA
jgi:hypothetical protein